MEKTLNTFYFGEVTIRECFDPATSNSGEGYIEVTDSNDNVVAVIYGYDIEEVDEDVICNNLL